MIGYPCAKSKSGFCVRRTSPAHGALLDGQAKALSLPRSQPTTHFLIYYAYRYYRFQWARDRGAFSRQKAPKCQSLGG